MKLCKDCTHHQAGFCLRPTFVQNRVTGAFSPLAREAGAERTPAWPEEQDAQPIPRTQPYDRCGPNGVYFEQRPPAAPIHVRAWRQLVAALRAS
jgi:hypothetical protein